ncbi:ATP-dependent helicase C29A10.10c [Salix suchowensis]|nr:ATP-dependent helicase C29A10.10c [Salix suchowensis]
MSRVKNVRICNDVLSVLGKLSNGWRQSRKKRRVMVHNGISSPLLEQYNSCGKLNMIWTVDILLENSSYVQVLMVWDILPSFDIPKLTMSLDSIFQNYTVEQMNRCLYKCMEGNLVVPMRWTADSRSARQGSSSEASTGKLLKSPCLDDELSTTAKAARNLIDPMRWTVDSRSARQGSSSEGSAGKLLKSPCPEDELSATAKAARYATALAGATLALSLP